MSQPPYPPSGSRAGADGPAGDGPEDPEQRRGTAPVQPSAQPQDGRPPYGQPPYGQPQYGQPQYGQPPYGQAQYGQPQYGQPPYGQPPYGQAQYGQPQYGQAPHGRSPQGQPPYAQAPYGQPLHGQGQPGGPVPPWGQEPAAPTSSRKLVAGLSAGLVLLIAVVAVALVVVLRSDGDSSDSSGAGGGGFAVPGATSDPRGLGDDPVLDDHAEDCHDGDMEACDDLFRESPLGSAYELYGGTCAGRQSNADARQIYCVDAFPPAG